MADGGTVGVRERLPPHLPLQQSGVALQVLRLGRIDVSQPLIGVDGLLEPPAQSKGDGGGIVLKIPPHGADLIDGEARLPQGADGMEPFHICLGKVQPGAAATPLGLR